MSLNINRSGSSCQHSYQNRNTSKYSRFDFIHDLRLFISSSRDEISVLLESAHQKERSSSEQKAEMAFKIMDRLISNSNYLYNYLFLYDVRHSVTIIPIPPGRVTIVTMLQNHHLQKPKIIFFRILFRE